MSRIWILLASWASPSRLPLARAEVMTRIWALLGLSAVFILVAAACSGASNMDSAAFTGGALVPEAETPEAATVTAEAPETGAPSAEAPEAEALVAGTSDTDLPGTEATAGSDLLDPRERGALRNFLGYEFPPAPAAPTGPIDQAAVDILEVIWAGFEVGGFDGGLVAGLGNTGDARLGWIMSDLLRFFYFGDIRDGSISAFEKLTGVRVADDPVAERSSWQSVTDHLIAWDLPAFPRYAEYKERLLTLVEPRWQPFFDDPEAAIDWRLVSWVASQIGCNSGWGAGSGGHVRRRV